jgi:GNAT superfamily N-acetyltransferase
MTAAVSKTPQVQLPLRTAHAGDRGAVRAFLHRLSPSTLGARYLSPLQRVAEPWGERELDRLLDRHGGKHMVVLAVDGSEVRGIGEYVEEPAGQAELALVVEDEYQGQRVGRVLLRTLEQLALEHGIRAFTGDVGYGNRRMLGLLRGSGRALQVELGYGSLRFSLVLRG